MTKEELKALGLTDEQVTKISEDYGKNYVAKSQFNEKNEALKNAEKEKGELSKQIEGLQKNNDSNAELKKQIEAMQAAAKTMETEHATQLAQMKLDVPAMDTEPIPAALQMPYEASTTATIMRLPRMATFLLSRPM